MACAMRAGTPLRVRSAEIHTFVSTTARTPPLLANLPDGFLDVGLDFLFRYFWWNPRLDAGAEFVEAAHGFVIARLLLGQVSFNHSLSGGIRAGTFALGKGLQLRVRLRTELHGRHRS